MAEPYTIPQEVQQRVADIGTSDIVVGIPSYNNAATVSHVAKAVQRGLKEHFPEARSVIVHADGGSTDGTQEQVQEAVPETDALILASYRLFPAEKLSTAYSGVPGKGHALRLIFQAARLLGASACAVVDSNLRSITPYWVKLLVQPVFEQGFDFIVPCYSRHKFDGTITNSLIYPMTRALYGKRLRQPAGGEFCASASLRDRFLSQAVWESEVARFGIDIWLTTQAVSGGFRLGQAFLGAKVQDAREPSVDLSGMLAQVLSAVFEQAERTVTVWQKVRGSEPIPAFGESSSSDVEPVKIDVGKMIDSFDIGFKNLFEIWSLVMPPATLLELKKLTQRGNSEFRFPDGLWVNVVYDFAVAYHVRAISRDHLLRAFTPLYLGWVASFVLAMQTADAGQVEARIEELCLRYETQKPYLISRWRWPDRFSP